MFIGHFAVGFAAKRIAPRTNLGLLLAAPLALDLLWPLFLLAGWERVRIDPGNTAFTPLAFDSYPWSHSLVMSIVWGALLAGLSWWRTADRRGALVLAAAVVSHWVCDWITHRPDMPLWPGHSPLLGLGLWNSIPATIVVESVLFVAGVKLYTGVTRARDRTGVWSLWSLVVLLGVLYAATANSPPPAVSALAVMGLVAWLFPLWGWWIDRHRMPVVP